MSNAIATVPVSASTIRMNRAIRWGAKRCGRRGSRPGRAYVGSGLVIGGYLDSTPRAVRERRTFPLWGAAPIC